MPTSQAARAPCYSVRLFRPFVEILRKDGRFPAVTLGMMQGEDPDERRPIQVILQTLEAAILVTGKPELGLLAAEQVARGDFDVLEYAAGSGATAGDALKLMMRYVPLLNDALEISLEVREGRAYVETRSAVPITRAATDYQIAAFGMGFQHWVDETHVPSDAEVWRTAPPPPAGSEYERVGRRNHLRWGAPRDLISFDAARLDRPMRSADPKLHAMLRRHADQALRDLPRQQNFTEETRQRVIELLPRGRATADGVADAFQINRRTLTRRLEREDTSFKAVLDEARHTLAVRYLDTTKLTLEEISFLLGFSGGPALSRAFKRWTGRSPQEHRRAPAASQPPSAG